VSAIRWVTEGRLKRADCCTRWEGDGYKEVVLAEDYERLEAALTEMTLQRDSWKRIAESGLGLTSETSWKPIDSAPRDGTHIWGQLGILARETWWGKASHVAMYGWCYLEEPGDVESCSLWHPLFWEPFTVKTAGDA